MLVLTLQGAQILWHLQSNLSGNIGNIATTAVDPYWWAQPVATSTAGLFVLFSAVLAYKAALKNRNSTEKAISVTDAREREAAHHERYTTIAEQLSSEQEMVRLAGAYGLIALADDWQKLGLCAQRDMVVELICAYLRATPRDNDDADVRRAFIQAIKNHTQKTDANRWPSKKINLYGVDLTLSDFENTDLSESNLANANLSMCNFNNAVFGEYYFRANKLVSAHLQGANLRRAKFYGCDLSGARLESSDLREAIFDIDINLANHEVLRQKCDLTWANLSGADVRGTQFSIAIVSRDDNNCVILAQRVLRGPGVEDEIQAITYDEKTSWPKMFDWAGAMENQVSA